MVHKIIIKRADGDEHNVQELPDHFNVDAEVLASELTHLCQRVYAMGRRDERSIIAGIFAEHQRSRL